MHLPQPHREFITTSARYSTVAENIREKHACSGNILAATACSRPMQTQASKTDGRNTTTTRRGSGNRKRTETPSIVTKQQRLPAHDPNTGDWYCQKQISENVQRSSQQQVPPGLPHKRPLRTPWYRPLHFSRGNPRSNCTIRINQNHTRQISRHVRANTRLYNDTIGAPSPASI